MKILIAEGKDFAHEAAAVMAGALRDAVAARGQALIGLSGGRTPWSAFAALAKEGLPWDRVHIFQVDERVVASDDAARNWSQLRDALLAHIAVPETNLHPMPVEDSDLAAAAARYGADLAALGGVFDLVQLGLGDDGHTASLVPGDVALAVHDKDVTLSGPYQGHQRMTLTYPALNRARAVLWLVTGTAKTEMVQRLCARDHAIPAGWVEQAKATLIADNAAAGFLASR